MHLDEKIALIIGAGGGIGRAGALALSNAGCAVVAADLDLEAATQTAEVVESAGGQALPVACDISSDEQVRALVAEAKQRFGRVDILWNAAGKALLGPPERTPPELWQQVHELNVIGSVRVFQSCAPEMMSRGDGHIVFTASRLGLFPTAVPGYGAPYVITKAALIALARSVAPYLRQYGVGVSLLIPGITATNHTFNIPTYDLDAAGLADKLDYSALQQPDTVAQRLVEGLRADEFMISCVPGTHERLVAEAERMYTPEAAAG